MEDQPPSLNPTTQTPPIISASTSNDIQVATNDAFIDNDSSSSNDSITTKCKPKWAQSLINESDDYITRFGGIKPRRINY